MFKPLIVVLVALHTAAGCSGADPGGRDAAAPMDASADIWGIGLPDNREVSLGPEAGPDVVAPDAIMASSQPRELIAAPIPEVASLTADNRAFAVRLHRALRAAAPAENLFFSPHSISVALAMTYGGARGETASQMASALELKLGAASLHRAFNALDQELARRGRLPAGCGGGEAPQLRVANALWGAQSQRFLPEYLDLLAVNYGAALFSLDFAGQTESARLTINRWAESQTSGRIKDLLGPGVIAPSTVLVLTNAVYFKGSWGQPFFPNATAPAPFNLPSGPPVAVPTMQRQDLFEHARTADYEAVQLRYVGGELAMLLIAPLPDRAAAFEAALSGAELDAVIATLTPKQVRLFLPRFGFSASFKLRPTLAALGMPLAFGAQADFSGMTGTGGLAISDVIHKTFVAVDEKGTEAAAATAVPAPPPSLPPPPIEVKMDRPFLFVIRDVPTGAVLFLGHLIDPRP